MTLDGNPYRNSYFIVLEGKHALASCGVNSNVDKALTSVWVDKRWARTLTDIEEPSQHPVQGQEDEQTARDRDVLEEERDLAGPPTPVAPWVWPQPETRCAARGYTRR